MALPAFAAERRAAAPLLLGARRPPPLIDISCPYCTQQQTRRTPLLRSIDGTESRPTFARPFHRPSSAYYAGSINKSHILSITPF